jgi:hypothetical protein
MRIHGIEIGSENGLDRVSATVTWEDSDRPQKEIYVERMQGTAEGFYPNPNGFLLAAIVPAMHFGEKRIQVEGSLCPELRNGLFTVMQQLREWYGPENHEPLAIEPTKGFSPPIPPVTRRVASFMSGGVDALTTLYVNRKDYPLDHPGSIKDGFIVHGIDVGGYEHRDKNIGHFQLAVDALSEIAEEAHLNLIPLSTNFRFLVNSDDLFALESHGATFAGIAHMHSRYVTTSLLASTNSVDELIPWGSHPLLEPNFSSSDLQIRHDGTWMTRLDKMRLIADWKPAMRNLRTCYHAFRSSDVLNCGKCEKCLRTMVELLIVGKLDQCQAFPYDDVTVEMIESLQTRPSGSAQRKTAPGIDNPPNNLNSAVAAHWRGMLKLLREIRREDLAAAIDEKLLEVKRQQDWLDERDWKGRIKRIDRKVSGGRLMKLRNIFQG